MTNFIRDLYESDISAMSKKFVYPDEIREAYNARERLYEKLMKNLDKDNLDLFEKYLGESRDVKDEELFHAYVSGMKDLLSLFMGVFCEQ